MEFVTKTIVVVEDEPDTAEMFAEMIRLAGYDVLKTYRGETAIDLISATRPDAVILDIMMPDLSGLDVLRYIRRDPRLAGTPVIVVSAKVLSADIKSGLEAGASLYLTKPIGYDELKKAVDSAVG